MKFLQSGVPIFLALALCCSGSKDRDWRIGTVLDSQAAKIYVQSGATRDTQLRIVGQEYAYVVEDSLHVKRGIVTRSIANFKHGCRFVVRDSVRYDQEKSKMYVVDADGKQCKLDIVRQERLQP